MRIVSRIVDLAFAVMVCVALVLVLGKFEFGHYATGPPLALSPSQSFYDGMVIAIDVNGNSLPATLVNHTDRYLIVEIPAAHLPPARAVHRFVGRKLDHRLYRHAAITWRGTNRHVLTLRI